MTRNIAALWQQFNEVIIDQNECIESEFHIWPVGTYRYDIWHWFDQNSKNGIVYLINGKES